MYFSGSEFHNKLLAISGIFKTKNNFERKINILEVTGNKYFLEQKLDFSVFNQCLPSMTRPIAWVILLSGNKLISSTRA